MKSFLAAVLVALSGVLPAAAAETVDAVWSEREVDFTFIGMEVAYSCQLMEARIAMLLEHVGAEDIDVTVPSCGAFPGPRKQLRVIAGFSTLVPAGDDDGEVIETVWDEVVLDKNHPRSISDDDCELLEQFQEYLLPTVDHQVVEGEVTCSATRRSIVGQLKIKVLKPIVRGATESTSDSVPGGHPTPEAAPKG